MKKSILFISIYVLYACSVYPDSSTTTSDESTVVKNPDITLPTAFVTAQTNAIKQTSPPNDYTEYQSIIVDGVTNIYNLYLNINSTEYELVHIYNDEDNDLFSTVNEGQLTISTTLTLLNNDLSTISDTQGYTNLYTMVPNNIYSTTNNGTWERQDNDTSYYIVNPENFYFINVTPYANFSTTFKLSTTSLSDAIDLLAIAFHKL